jgi:P27 family predicted phage terminase small subunit
MKVGQAGAKPKPIEQRERTSRDPFLPLPVLVGGRVPDAEWLGPCPDTLDAYGRAAWDEVVPMLMGANILDRVDVHIVEAYCLHMGRARALREAIEWKHVSECTCPEQDHDPTMGCKLGTRIRRLSPEESFTAITARGFTSNPLLSQEREALREVRYIGELLGLNPVGRARLAMAKAGPRKGAGLSTVTGALPKPGQKAG